MKKILVLLIFSLLVLESNATTFTWIGGTGLWSTPSNWDQNDVPKPLDVVIIMGGSSQVTMNVNVEIKRLEISDEAGLLILAGISLKVIGDVFGDFTDNVVCKNGALVNHGTISIEDSLFLEDAVFFNMHSGIVQNTDPAGIGWIEMDHPGIAFTNNGEISMNNLLSNGEFNNRGTIYSNVSVTGTVTNYHRMYGSINQGGTFTNNGFIYNFIRVGGTFENDGSIVIDKDGGNTNGLEVFGTFINNNLVDIRKLSNPASPCTGINIKDGSNFVNNASIDIDSVSGIGIQSEADLVTNSAFANIWIKDIIPYSGPVGYGIVLTDAPSETDGSNFLNDGLLWIENIDGFGIQFNDNSIDRVTLTNNKLVDIKDAFNGGITMVEYNAPFFPIRGHFINNTNADLNVSMSAIAGQTGIECRVTNYGDIDVSDNYLTGIEGYLVNYGTVNTNGTARGMDVEYLNNASTGQINSVKSVYTDSINNYYGPSINEGTINISAGELWLQQHLINMPCGSIHVGGSLVTLNSKKLYNRGVLTVLQHHSDIRDSLYNTGVIYDRFGILASDNDFHNDGVYITQVNGSFACGDMVNNISYGNNIASIPSPTVSIDRAGTMSAGTYDLPNHRVTLAGTTGGMDTLYSHFQLAPGCDRTVPIPFDNTVTCVSCNDNIWTGNTSTDWHTSSNWSKSVIPTSCQIVKINSNNVVVAPGMIGICLLLEVAAGATLEVNGQLDVVGN